MSEIKAEILCIFFPEKNCPINCPHHARVKKDIQDLAENHHITIEAAVQQIRSDPRVTANAPLLRQAIPEDLSTCKNNIVQ